MTREERDELWKKTGEKFATAHKRFIELDAVLKSKRLDGMTEERDFAEMMLNFIDVLCRFTEIDLVLKDVKDAYLKCDFRSTEGKDDESTG